jgi:hypothetical protein
VTSVSKAAGLIDDDSGDVIEDICARFLDTSVTKHKVKNREK